MIITFRPVEFFAYLRHHAVLLEVIAGGISSLRVAGYVNLALPVQRQHVDVRQIEQCAVCFANQILEMSGAVTACLNLVSHIALCIRGQCIDVIAIILAAVEPEVIIADRKDILNAQAERFGVGGRVHFVEIENRRIHVSLFIYGVEEFGLRFFAFICRHFTRSFGSSVTLLYQRKSLCVV